MSIIYINPYQFAVAGPPPAGWTPADISTELWLDGADASTITLVSGKVSQWDDKKGNGRSATQTNAALRPVYSATGLGGKGAVALDTATGQLSVNSFGSGTYSWFCALGASSGTTLTLIGGVNTFIPLAVVSTNSNILRVNGTNDPSSASQLYNGESTQSVVLRTDVYYKLSSAAVTDAIAAYVNIPVITSTVRLGWTDANASYGYTGFAGEFIVVSGTPSTTDRQKIEGYLAHKWGMTGNLPAGHPYKTVAP
jgi:hypothetical protein